MRKYFFAMVFIVYLSHILWSQRAIFTEKFDREYWKERYESSQWVLPLSTRIIGDDGLYLFQGNELVDGADLSKYNPEVPPFGKYLIGVAIKLFNNGNVYGYITTLSLVVAVWFLAKRLTGNKTVAWATMLLFATDPLITSQFSLTMLDSLQSLFLVLHIIALSKFIAHPKSLKWVIISGMLLGFFAGSKAPLFAPIVMVTGVAAIWITTKKFIWVSVYILGALLTYLCLYSTYFYHDHSLIDWFKLQKWIISFYFSSELKSNFGSIFTTLFFNQTKDLFSDIWYSSREWSITWPVITVFSIVSYKWKKNRLLFGTLLLLIFIFFIRPFWVRYLILVLPLLYVSAVVFIHTKFSPRIALGGIIAGIVINICFSIPSLYPTAEKEFQQFALDWEHGYFHDMRQRFTNESKMKFGQKEIQRQGLTYIYDAQIEAADVRFDPNLLRKRFGQRTIPVEVVYRTRNLGEFVEHTSVYLVNEKNQWRVSWDWESFISGLTPGATITTTVDSATRGTLTKDGFVASDFDSELLSVTPIDVDPQKEQEMLEFVSELFENKLFPLSIHQRYIANTLPDRPRPIGVFPTRLTPKDRERLLSYSGISLVPAVGRTNLVSSTAEVDKVTNTLFIECCSLLYSTTSYDGGGGLEKEFNSILKGISGGSIVIYDAKGKLVRTILTRKKQNGFDVRL